MNEQELIALMAESEERSKQFVAMTNAELADALMYQVWAYIELFSPDSDLLLAAIDRLRGDE